MRGVITTGNINVNGEVIKQRHKIFRSKCREYKKMIGNMSTKKKKIIAIKIMVPITMIIIKK